jgi:hypothetical protein
LSILFGERGGEIGDEGGWGMTGLSSNIFLIKPNATDLLALETGGGKPGGANGLDVGGPWIVFGAVVVVCGAEALVAELGSLSETPNKLEAVSWAVACEDWIFACVWSGALADGPCTTVDVVLGSAGPEFVWGTVATVVDAAVVAACCGVAVLLRTGSGLTGTNTTGFAVVGAATDLPATGALGAPPNVVGVVALLAGIVLDSPMALLPLATEPPPCTLAELDEPVVLTAELTALVPLVPTVVEPLFAPPEPPVVLTTALGWTTVPFIALATLGAEPLPEPTSLRALGSLELTAPPVDLELLEGEPLAALVVPLDCDAGALGIFEMLVFAGVALDVLVCGGDALEELALVASFVLFVAFIFELGVFAELVAKSTGPLAVTMIVALVFDGLPADLRKLSLL